MRQSGSTLEKRIHCFLAAAVEISIPSTTLLKSSVLTATAASKTSLVGVFAPLRAVAETMSAETTDRHVIAMATLNNIDVDTSEDGPDEVFAADDKPSAPSSSSGTRSYTTESQRQDLKTNPSESDFVVAAAYVLDACKGRRSHYRPNERDVRYYEMYNHEALAWALYLCIGLHLSLALFEKPAVKGLELDYWVTMIVESFCLLFYAFRFCHALYFSETSLFWADRKNIMLLSLLCLTFVDIIVFLVLQANGIQGIRWSRALRPLFATSVPEGKHIRRTFRNIQRTLPDILNVLILFFLSLAIFSLMAFKLFSKRNLRYANGNSYFDSLGDSLFDLYVFVTTANSPDVMIPAYDTSRWFAIFFILFLVICLYIFMSIILAVVYNNYRKHLKNEVIKSVYRKRRQLSQAFDALQEVIDGKPALSKEKFDELVARILPKRNQMYRDILWVVLNTTASGYICKAEFLQLAGLLNVELSEVRDRVTLIEKFFPNMYNSKTSNMITKMVKHRYFRYAFDSIIVLNAVFIALDLDAAEWFFLTIFALEIILKLYAFGGKEFFKRFWNIFDFFVIGSAFIIALAEEIQNNDRASRLSLDVLLVLRVLRLVKIMGSIERFEVIVGTIIALGPSILIYGGVLLVFYYMYAIVGMELFNGLVEYHGYNKSSQTPEQLFCGSAKLNGSDFWHLHYCNSNFNDILQAMMLMFTLTVVNQWHVITSGFVLVTSKVARIYFFAFHVSCVVIILNIFTAFVLEVFLLKYTLFKGRYETAIEIKLNEMGLGLGSKPCRAHHEEEEELVSSIEEQELDADHDPRQMASENGTKSATDLPNLSKQTDIRFYITNRYHNLETLLHHMFENEIEVDDIGPEFLDEESLKQVAQKHTVSSRIISNLMA